MKSNEPSPKIYKKKTKTKKVKKKQRENQKAEDPKIALVVYIVNNLVWQYEIYHTLPVDKVQKIENRAKPVVSSLMKAIFSVYVISNNLSLFIHFIDKY